LFVEHLQLLVAVQAEKEPVSASESKSVFLLGHHYFVNIGFEQPYLFNIDKLRVVLDAYDVHVALVLAAKNGALICHCETKHEALGAYLVFNREIGGVYKE
jgi:hypothetical protein